MGEGASPLQRLIRSRRIELQLTQRRAADRAGLSLATWEALERRGGRGGFRDLTLSQVASALELPIEAVFAAAGREWTGASSAGAVSGGDATAAVDDSGPGRVGDSSAAELAEHARALLLRLHEASEDDFMLVYAYTMEFAERLLEARAR